MTISLRRSWPMVAACVAVVVALVCLLWPSGRSDSVVLSAATEQHGVRLTIENPRTGPGSWIVEVTDPQGRPVSPGRVLLEPAMPVMGHAIPPLVAAPEAPGRFRAAAALTMSGPWEITVTVGNADRVVFPVLITG